jgi:hypothetical protein
MRGAAKDKSAKQTSPNGRLQLHLGSLSAMI